MGVQIPAEYRPSESEPFMNERQREYFRRKLNGWKEEILRESRETIQNLQAETVPHADPGIVYPLLDKIRHSRDGLGHSVRRLEHHAGYQRDGSYHQRRHEPGENAGCHAEP